MRLLRAGRAQQVSQSCRHDDSKKVCNARRPRLARWLYLLLPQSSCADSVTLRPLQLSGCGYLMQGTASQAAAAEPYLDQDIDLPDANCADNNTCTAGESTHATDHIELDIATCHQAQARIAELQAQKALLVHQYAQAERDMGIFRAHLADRNIESDQLQRQLTESGQKLRRAHSELRDVTLECSALHNRCREFQQQQHQMAQELADTRTHLASTQQELKASKHKNKADAAKNHDLQEQLSVLTQHLTDETVRKSGACTLSIAFDNVQRQQQYTPAVKSLLQPIEDKYVLDVEILQKPKKCNFLLYVTFSSTARLVNFDTHTFEQFKQDCATGEHFLHSYMCSKLSPSCYMQLSMMQDASFCVCSNNPNRVSIVTMQCS